MTMDQQSPLGVTSKVILSEEDGAVAEGVWATEGEQTVSIKERPAITATLTVEPQA